MITFKYIPEKAQQAILYTAGKLDSDRNMYRVLKALYFADIEHLHEFGRFIYGDNYVALQHGPVPSKAYNLVQNARAKSDLCDEDHSKSDNLFTVKDNDTIIPLIQADLNCFSKSDLLCLDNAIEKVRPLTFKELKKLSHDAAYKEAGVNDNMSIESIVGMSPESEALLEHLNSLQA